MVDWVFFIIFAPSNILNNKVMEKYILVVIILTQSALLFYAGYRHSKVCESLNRIKKKIEKGTSVENVSDEIEEVIKEFF